MSMGIEIVDPLEYEGWDDLVLGFKGCTFFHSSSWMRVLKETYNYKPIVFLFGDETNVFAILPIMEVNSILTGRRGVSLPFTDFCGPIFFNNDVCPEILSRLIDYGVGKKWKYLELRGSLAFMKDRLEFASYYHHDLSLDVDHEGLFEKFRGSTKRNIKKSVKEGVTVNLSTSFEDVEKFYVLNCITRKRHGLPPQPFKFFRKIYEHIISTEKGFVAIGRWRGKEVGASIYFHFGDKAIYKYGASDISYQNLRANNLIMWEAIKWYSQNGFKNFSFGRTAVENEGLLQFKRGWGVREERIPYYRFDPNSFQMIKEVKKNNSFQRYSEKLPIAALRALGSVLYRHVG